MKKVLKGLIDKIEIIHEWIEDSLIILWLKLKKDKGKPFDSLMKELS